MSPRIPGRLEASVVALRRPPRPPVPVDPPAPPPRQVRDPMIMMDGLVVAIRMLPPKPPVCEPVDPPPSAWMLQLGPSVISPEGLRVLRVTVPPGAPATETDGSAE